MTKTILTLIVLALPIVGRAAPAPKLDTARIEQLTGLKGKLDDKEGVFKVSLPRSDIYWGIGAVDALAKGVRAGLEVTEGKRKGH